MPPIFFIPTLPIFVKIITGIDEVEE